MPRRHIFRFDDEWHQRAKEILRTASLILEYISDPVARVLNVLQL